MESGGVKDSTMCITLQPALLSSTFIYGAEVEHDGKVVHVLGYQNKVSNSKGPNAMVLPFPALGKVGPENLVNGEPFKGILSAYDKAIQRLQPQTKGLRELKLPRETSNGFEVFQSGSYTIALVEQVSWLPIAIRKIPITVRPRISPRFVTALIQLYPHWPIALCCFNGDMSEPEPLFWWYEPRFKDRLFAPAIDAHDGDPPNLEAAVHRSHTIAFASHASKRKPDADLAHEIYHQVPAAHQWMFNARVCGRMVHGKTKNGDFVYPLSGVRDPKINSWLDVNVTPPTQALS
jgi:hypothetical protein